MVDGKGQCTMVGQHCQQCRLVPCQIRIKSISNHMRNTLLHYLLRRRSQIFTLRGHTQLVATTGRPCFQTIVTDWLGIQFNTHSFIFWWQRWNCMAHRWPNVFGKHTHDRFAESRCLRNFWNAKNEQLLALCRWQCRRTPRRRYRS